MDKKTINVLLIEDSSSDADLVQRMLRGGGTYTSNIDWVQSLELAFGSIQGRTYDLILTDLGLPDSSGLDTLVNLRKFTDQIPIIALTGEDDDDLGLAAIRAGASDVLPKDLASRPIFSRAVIYAIERFQVTSRLKEANKLLESKNERLTKMCNMSQQFVDNVSHEFRTPLTVIREFASIIQDGIDGPVTGKQSERLSTLITRTDDLAMMVDDLLDTSRLETGLLKTCRQENNLHDIVSQVLTTLLPRASAKKISLKAQDVPVDLDIFCDEEKLRRILINLIVNAIKFTPVDGKIEISAALVDRDRVKITVSDNGPGIPQDDLDRIFDRFQQVEAHHRMASCKGFGLGLSIARALASLNLGSLQVCSKEGQGSQFSVLIPVARLDAVLNCYLEQRAATLIDTGDISIVEVRPGDYDLQNHNAVLETIDEFLRSNVKTFDLVLKMQEDRWLMYTCNSESTLPSFMDRISNEWSKLTRNHFGATLPPLLFQCLETAGIVEGRSQLMNVAFSAQAESSKYRAMPRKQKTGMINLTRWHTGIPPRIHPLERK